MQHIEGAAWTFLTVIRYDSWQKYATNEANSVAQTNKKEGCVSCANTTRSPSHRSHEGSAYRVTLLQLDWEPMSFCRFIYSASAEKTRTENATAARVLLLHQEHGSAPLDFARDLTVQMRRHSGDAARKNLATFRDKLFQEIGILVIDRFEGDIDPTARHRPVGAAKSGTAFGCLGLHDDYFVSRCKVCLLRNGLYFFFSRRFGVWGLFLFRVLM